IVGAGTTVFGVDTDNAAMTHTCTLTDAAAAPIQIAALGAGKVNAADTTETLVVWTKSGQLLLYAPTVWSGTTGGRTGTPAPTAAVDTGFMPGTGAQVFTLHDSAGKDTTQIVLAARQAGTGGAPNGNAATIQMFDLNGGTPTMVGSPIGKEGLHGMAIASFD